MNFFTDMSGWRTFPNGTRAAGHLFAIPDIHGRADLLERLLSHIADVPVCSQERILVFLGDLINRGPENFRVIDLAMNANDRCKKRVLLPGNHEGMLLDGLFTPLETGNFHHWYKNGGDAVIDELPGGGRGTPEELRRQLREALPEEFLDHMRTAPGYFQCGDLLLVHAGLRPPLGSHADEERARFLAQPLMDAPRMHWAWIRDRFLMWKGGWDPARREVVVHGHTIMCENPSCSAEEAAENVDFISSHARISLDLGAVFYDQLIALEAIDDRYRFHFVKLERYLP